MNSILFKRLLLVAALATPVWCDELELARKELPGVQVRLSREAPENREGYWIRKTAGQFEVLSRSPAGAYYGVQALKAMGSQPVEVRDEPALRWRGVQVDMSRGPVPTLEYLKRVVDRASRCKLNLLGLYMEHNFELKKHPLVGPPGGTLTQEEAGELVRYAAARFVTVMPEQQVFGHLHHVLKHERYQDLAEKPHGHVLAPSQATYSFIRDVYAETIPVFPGPFLHIGADETVELGKGRTAPAVAEKGLGRVYLEHLQEVVRVLQPSGKRIVFWGDIAVDYPELLSILPKNTIAMPWNYNAGAKFDELIAPFEKAGLETFVAPGTNNWNRVYPDLEIAAANIGEFIEAGKRHRSLGVLITTWNDDNEGLFELNWPSIRYGAACAWSRGPVRWAAPAELQPLESLHALLRSQGLGSVSHHAFWLDPFSHAGRRYDEKGRAVASALRLAAEKSLEMQLKSPDPDPAWVYAARRTDALGLRMQLAPRVSAEYRQALQHLDNPRQVNYILFELAGVNGILQDLRDSVTALKAEYAALWARENRPYYLDNVLVRYDLMAQHYQSKIHALQAAQRQYGETRTLPSAEELGL